MKVDGCEWNNINIDDICNSEREIEKENGVPFPSSNIQTSTQLHQNPAKKSLGKQ